MYQCTKQFDAHGRANVIIVEIQMGDAFVLHDVRQQFARTRRTELTTARGEQTQRRATRLHNNTNLHTKQT